MDYDIPDRIRDGYGLNIDLIDRALDDDIDTIITCDNGIAAKNEIAYGKSMGMSIIVTDHHEVPYEEKEDGTRVFLPQTRWWISNGRTACIRTRGFAEQQ